MSQLLPPEKRWGTSILIGLIPGLAVAQVIATLQVYLSNLEIYHRTIGIGDAGFLAVPNEKILPLLLSLENALCGGLFFTLTIGIFLSLISFVFFRLYQSSTYRKIVFLSGLCLWCGLIGCFNAAGFNPFATAYVFLIPLVVFMASRRWTGDMKSSLTIKNVMVHSIVVLFLMGIWSIEIDKDFFIDFRDNLLFSNKLGMALNDFYYDYTLYPAETFKPLNKRILKTYRWVDFDDAAMKKRIEKKLMTHDYLPMDSHTSVDLLVGRKDTTLLFKNKNGIVLGVDTATFFKAPEKYLNKVSRILDNNHFFRRFILVSLLVGLPVFLFILLFTGIRYLFSWYLADDWSLKAAAATSLMMGLAILMPFHMVRASQYGNTKVDTLLSSGDWRTRAAGLKRVCGEKLEIADYPVYKKNMDSPYVAERYWLAMALSVSRKPDTFSDLQQMLDDAQPNVVCKVLYAVGRRGNQSFIPIIKLKLKTSRHWYIQTYAYAALKDLGWRQKKSP